MDTAFTNAFSELAVDGLRWEAIPVARCLTSFAATLPGRPRRVIAKPEEVFMGSPLSGITRSIVGHDPVAMASTAGGVVGLYR